MTSAPVDDDARPLTHHRHHPPAAADMAAALDAAVAEVPFSHLLLALLDFPNISMWECLWWKFRSSKLTHFEVNVDESLVHRLM